MNLSEIAEALNLSARTCKSAMDREVGGGYASDLLSDVMGRARKGDVWVTMQTHQNVVAVAVLKEMAAIIIVNGREPESDTAQKAEEEGIPLLVSAEPTFEVVGKLYSMGIRASSDA